MKDQQQQQQQHMLLEAQEKYRMERKDVVMLMSTIIMDKDSARWLNKQKNGRQAVIFYWMRIFCTELPVSVYTVTK
jgi:hypothetical protein